jgi:uncharacterized protein
MRIIHFIAAVWIGFAFTAGGAGAQDAGLEQRTTMARELISLSSGPNFAKAMEQYVAAEVAKASEGEGEEAEWARTNMPIMVSRMMTGLMADLAPVYAETFTTEELEAQIAFYRTPLGRQIAAKAVELGIAQEALMQEAMVSFMTEVEAKYCAEFDCGTMSDGAAAKPAR